MLAPCKKSYDQPRQHIKKQTHCFADKGLSCQSYGFPVVMYGCECWTIKKAEHWRIDVFELWCWRSLLRDPWTASKPVNPEGNQPWILIGRIYAEALILWPSDVKSRLIRKDPDAGQDWRQEKKGTTEDVMVGWHHRLNGREFEQTQGYGEGRGRLACCSPWGRKELDTIEQLSNNKSMYDHFFNLYCFCTWVKEVFFIIGLHKLTTDSIFWVVSWERHD